MSYRDEIVDEVRSIREKICTQAGSLENLLAMLRAEEAGHPGRMVGMEQAAWRNTKGVSIKCAEQAQAYRVSDEKTVKGDRRTAVKREH